MTQKVTGHLLARNRAFGGGPCASGAGNALSLSAIVVAPSTYSVAVRCRYRIPLSPPYPSRCRSRKSPSLAGEQNRDAFRAQDLWERPEFPLTEEQSAADNSQAEA